MELTIAADVAIDLATKDDLNHHHERVRELLAERRDARAYMISGTGATGSGFAAPATGLGISISFTPQSPPPGRLWLVQWAAVWVGNNPAAGAVANVFAALAVGNCATGPGAPPAPARPPNASDIVIPAQAVPDTISPPGKVWVKSQQELYAFLQGSGLAASTVYNLSAGIVDVPDIPEALFW